MEIKDRLIEVLKRKNLNASSFADILKIQKSNVSHILSGRNKPSLDFIQKFINAFPNEDVVWLITGNQINELKSPKKEIQKTENETNLKSNLKLDSSGNNKEISRIITFYRDNTFDVFQPNS